MPNQESPSHPGIISLPAPVVAEIGRTIASAIRRHSCPLGDDELLTPEEVGRIFRVPSRHARSLMADGRIPSTDIPDVGLRCTVAALRAHVQAAVSGEDRSE